MKIEYHYLPPKITIEEFAEKHDLTMEVHERLDGAILQNKFYANFKRCEVKNCGILQGVYGDGATPEQAIANYAKEISGKLLVSNAYYDGRIEIRCPRFA